MNITPEGYNKMFRCSLTKHGRVQAVVRMPESRVRLSALSKSDERRVLELRIGEEFTDADQDKWLRTA